MAPYLKISILLALALRALCLTDIIRTTDQKHHTSENSTVLQRWNFSYARVDIGAGIIADDSRNKRHLFQPQIGHIGNEGMKYIRPPKYIHPPRPTSERIPNIKFLGRRVPVADEFRCGSIRLPHTMRPIEKECYCDRECVIFHDCCVDAFKLVFGTEDEEIIKTNAMAARRWYIQSQKFTIQTKYVSLMAEYSTCVIVNVNKHMKRQSYYMISRCPTGSNDNLRHKCEHSTSTVQRIPASYKITTLEIVFKNPFCAMCHGIDKKDIQLWKTSAVCPANINASITNTATLNRAIVDRCNIVVDEPIERYDKLRKCTSQKWHDTCNVDTIDTHGIDDDLACHLYVAPVRCNGNTYRNIHCVFCNNRGVSAKYDNVQILHHATEGFSLAGGGFIGPWPSPPPFYSTSIPFAHLVLPGMFPTQSVPIVLNIGFSFITGFSLFSESGNVHKLEDTSCQEGFVFDVISVSCKQIICTLGKMLVGSECVHDSSIYVSSNPELLPVYGHDFDDIVNVNFVIKKLEPAINNTEIREIIDEFAEHIILSEGLNMTMILTNITGNSALSELELTYVLSRNNLADSILVIEKLNTLIAVDHFQPLQILDITVSNMFPDEDLHCPGDNPTVVYHNMDVVVENDFVYALNETEYAFNLNNSRYILHFDINSSNFTGSDIIICRYLKCGMMVSLETNEYWLSNGSLVLNATGEVLRRDEFEFRDNNVLVCLRVPLNTHPIYIEFIYDRTSLIVQYCATSLSIIALVFTIVIYFKSASIHTLHGMTLVSMSVTLIVTQVTSLLQTQKEGIVCKMVAVILHLAVLSTFSWMSVISFDMTRTLVSTSPITTQKRSKCKRYTIYACVGWGIPAIIVIICIVLDNTDTILTTHYGDYGFCFIGNGKSLLAFYSNPYCISLTFNIVAFVITVRSIATRRTNPNARKNDRLRFCIIYFKLAIVMGLTGTLAILASITGWIWLWKVSIILGSLQGVFMFLIFAMKARIWRAIKLRHSSAKSNERSVTIDTEVITIATLHRL